MVVSVGVGISCACGFGKDVAALIIANIVSDAVLGGAGQLVEGIIGIGGNGAAVFGNAGNVAGIVVGVGVCLAPSRSNYHCRHNRTWW